MKNIKVNHQFTLREILESIDNEIHSEGSFQESWQRASRKVKFFLGMVKCEE